MYRGQEDDIAADYLSALLARQLEEVEDAEMLVSRVLFNSWQDKKYWLETISDEAKETQTSSETSGWFCLENVTYLKCFKDVRRTRMIH